MDHEPLLHAVLAMPDDDEPRLRYADWLVEQGDPRGEFIQVQCEFAKRDQSTPDWHLRWKDLAEREAQLLDRYRTQWAEPLAGLVDDWTFGRGFVEHVTVRAAAFLARADQIFAVAPVRHLDVTDAKGCWPELLGSPHLDWILSLNLAGNRLDDTDVQALADSSHVAGLRWLSLDDNDIGEVGVEALAASTRLPQLAQLTLYGTRCNPIEQAIRDWVGTVASTTFPVFGEQLETRYGYKRWLHVLDESRFPPVRFAVR